MEFIACRKRFNKATKGQEAKSKCTQRMVISLRIRLDLTSCVLRYGTFIVPMDTECSFDHTHLSQA